MKKAEQLMSGPEFLPFNIFVRVILSGATVCINTKVRDRYSEHIGQNFLKICTPPVQFIGHTRSLINTFILSKNK